MLDHKARSSRNEITAPRIQAYVRFGADRDEPFTTSEQAQEWVRDLVDRAKAEEDFEIRQPGIGPTIDSDAGIGN